MTVVRMCNGIWERYLELGSLPGMRSYASGALSMGFGAVSSSSAKQKVGSIISTDAELIIVEDKMIKVTWERGSLKINASK